VQETNGEGKNIGSRRTNYKNKKATPLARNGAIAGTRKGDPPRKRRTGRPCKVWICCRVRGRRQGGKESYHRPKQTSC